MTFYALAVERHRIVKARHFIVQIRKRPRQGPHCAPQAGPVGIGRVLVRPRSVRPALTRGRSRPVERTTAARIRSEQKLGAYPLLANLRSQPLDAVPPCFRDAAGITPRGGRVVAADRNRGNAQVDSSGSGCRAHWRLPPDVEMLAVAGEAALRWAVDTGRAGRLFRHSLVGFGQSPLGARCSGSVRSSGPPTTA
jgi:hypothetical protein